MKTLDQFLSSKIQNFKQVSKALVRARKLLREKFPIEVSKPLLRGDKGAEKSVAEFYRTIENLNRDLAQFKKDKERFIAVLSFFRKKKKK